MFSILIPFRDKIPLLEQCLQTMKEALQEDRERTEILLLNNRSQKGYRLTIPDGLNVKVIDVDIPFHFQKIMNIGAKHATGKYLLFLNNDVIFTQESRNFLSRLHAHASRREIGAVGPLLYFPNGKIQHAGVVIGLNGLCYHLYFNWSKEKIRKFPFKGCEEERFVAAVTGACLMVEKAKFEAVGGMDERFQVYGGDVDLCLRLEEKGHPSYYLGSLSLIHLETQTIDQKKLSCHQQDLREMERSFGAFLMRHEGRDPYYPPPLPLFIPRNLYQRLKRTIKNLLRL